MAENMGSSVLAVVCALRTGRTGQAAQGFADLLQALSPDLEKRFRGPDGQWVGEVLRALLDAQQAGDAIRLADTLEYDLLPRLGNLSRGSVSG